MSKFLFTALALAIIVSLFASYFVALTVVPLFCAFFVRRSGDESHEGSTDEQEALPAPARRSIGGSFNVWFSRQFERLLSRYDKAVAVTLGWPRLTLAMFFVVFACSLLLFPQLGVAFFPRTDAGQFMINFKAASGTKLNATEEETIRLEQLIRKTVLPSDLDTIVSNIGVNPGFSALFSPNSAMHTGFVQVNLKEGHQVGSYDYIERVKRRMQDELPELAAFFSSGSLVDGVLNMGAPAPIAVQVAGSDLNVSYKIAQNLAAQFRDIPGVADVYIPQDLDYPSLRLNIDRTRASELGLTEREVVSNVITALTSNQMIAPSVWIDPKNGNNYFLTVQYKEAQIKDLADIRAIPLHGANLLTPHTTGYGG